MNKFGQVVGITFISQVLALLNVAFSPFKGTIFVFDEWESQASKTAIAVGFVVVAVVVPLNLGASKPDFIKRTKVSMAVTLFLFVICAVIYFVLKSGYAPTVNFLFSLRDIGWMVVYIVMLVMVGITIAFAQLLLYFGGSGSGRGRSHRPRADLTLRQRGLASEHKTFPGSGQKGPPTLSTATEELGPIADANDANRRHAPACRRC